MYYLGNFHETFIFIFRFFYFFMQNISILILILNLFFNNIWEKDNIKK